MGKGHRLSLFLSRVAKSHCKKHMGWEIVCGHLWKQIYHNSRQNKFYRKTWGTWVAELVKHPTLGFNSGHDLVVLGFKPHIRLCADSAEPAWDSLFPLSLPSPACTCMHTLSK